jgi:hypoxanthine phosphoribosyltransferase
MLHYRSFADLAWTVTTRLAKIPIDVDLVVGIPRSGLFAAWYIALMRNRPILELPAMLDGASANVGLTRSCLSHIPPRRILLVDDSTHSGKTFRQAVTQLKAQFPELSICRLAVYAENTIHPDAEVVLESCPFPRIFEWNMYHSWMVERSFYDMDGVICRDPTPSQNADETAYRRFLETAEPLMLPTGRIRKIVTSRLDKHRAATQDWLARYGVCYDELLMLDLESAVERRRLGVHGEFKATAFREDPEALLFIESDSVQAALIVQMTRKSVFDFGGRRMVQPNFSDAIYAHERVRQSWGKSWRQVIKRLLRRQIRRLAP